jgi:hypothetical protein
MKTPEAGPNVSALSDAERDSIKAAALDYVEGYFEGNPERMRRCLHPELVKRSLWHSRESGDWGLGRISTKDDMVGWARDGAGKDAPDGGRPITVTVEDAFRHIASVKVESGPFMDYLHLAKLGDQWLIVNVLWEVTQGEREPPPSHGG